MRGLCVCVCVCVCVCFCVGSFRFRLLFKFNVYLSTCYDVVLYVFFRFFSFFAKSPSYTFGKVLNTPMIALLEVLAMKTLPMFDKQHE